MSDLDGEYALGMVLDRLEQRHVDHGELKAERDKLRHELWVAGQEVERLKRELEYERSRPKAPGSPPSFAETPVVPRPAAGSGDDPIPF